MMTKLEGWFLLLDLISGRVSDLQQMTAHSTTQSDEITVEIKDCKEKAKQVMVWIKEEGGAE